MLVVRRVSTQWSSVQFSCSVVSDSLWPHELQHARLPCPSPTPEVYSNSCPLSWWCYLTISSSVVPFCPAFNLSQHQGLFKWVSSFIRWPKYWSFTQTPVETQWRLLFFSHDEDIFSNYFQYCIFKWISEEFSIKSNN